MPRLKLKRVADDQLDALAENVREDIELALLQIQAHPEEAGVQMLGSLSDRWRKRVGGYRIVYRILENGGLVIVDAIKKRGDAY